ncbi:MAG: hypothetical protein KAX40_04845, partial [Herpetosiphon sp.]|nr:hypothetical protein [Herpetosiphon sp.]
MMTMTNTDRATLFACFLAETKNKRTAKKTSWIQSDFDRISSAWNRQLSHTSVHHLDIMIVCDLPPAKIIDQRVTYITAFLVWCTQQHQCSRS